MNTSRRSVNTLRTLGVSLAMIIAPVAALTAAQPASAASCKADWGSLAKRLAPFTGTQITNVRSGRHACFDRLVVDLNGDGPGRPGYRVRYVARVAKDGSGAPVPLRGGAQLRLIVKAPAYDGDGQPTYEPTDTSELVDVAAHRTFRQVAWAGSFEGQTTIGVGVRARLPMRVLVLDGPGGGRRVVLDVAHRWY